MIVLGPVGYNLGAGMTGGETFVWDPGGLLATRLNTALVEAGRPDAGLLEELRWTVERHLELTGSAHAAALLENWSVTAAAMWLVVPIDQMRRIEAQQAARVTASA